MRRAIKRLLGALSSLPPPYHYTHRDVVLELMRRGDYTAEQARAILFMWRKRGCRLRHGRKIRQNKRRRRDRERREADRARERDAELRDEMRRQALRETLAERGVLVRGGKHGADLSWDEIEKLLKHARGD